MRRTTILSLILFTFLPASSLRPAAQQLNYLVTDLGSFGGTLTFAGGVNNSGVVAGTSNFPGDTQNHAFLWRNGILTDLGALGGDNSGALLPPSNRGMIGGFAESLTPDAYAQGACGQLTGYTCVAVVWYKGTVTPLPTLGGINARAHGVNNWGQVVGVAETSAPDPSCIPAETTQVLAMKAVLWQNGVAHELPAVVGDSMGDAFAINDRGQAVGSTGDCVNYVHAVLWQNGSVTDLGTLGGSINNWAEYINNRGQIVGASSLAGDQAFHGFLWQNGTMTDLGVLSGDVSSEADGINSGGQIVGGSFDENGGARAFLWQKGVMTDLNSLIPPDSPLYLLEAWGINDRGQIAGIAWNMGTGTVDGFLATPVTYKGEVGAARATSTAKPRVTLPENLRKLLPRRSAFGRFNGVSDRQ